MYQVDQLIWNEIAETGLVQTPTFKRLFSTTLDDRDQILEEQAKKMEKSGVTSRVILSYQTVTSLLMENKAISAYLRMTDRYDLSAVFPEVLTVNEAVYLMIQEYMLSDDESSQLSAMLEKLF